MEASACSHDMTVKELKEMVRTASYNSICGEIEKRGFRRAGESFVFEFERDLLKKSRYQRRVEKEDENTDKHFCVTLYRKCRAYKGVTFMEVCFSKMNTLGKQRIPIPHRIVLYTNAPINEEYERDINSIVKCDLCGREYLKKELVSFYDEKILCEECFCSEMDSQS